MVKFKLRYNWNNVIGQSIRDRLMTGFSEKATDVRIKTLYIHELSRLKTFLERDQFRTTHKKEVSSVSSQH